MDSREERGVAAFCRQSYVDSFHVARSQIRDIKTIFTGKRKEIRAGRTAN